MTRRVLYISTWILLIGIIWYGTRDSAAHAKGRFTAALESAISFPGTLIKGIWHRASFARQLSSLAVENQNLRAQLFELREQAGIATFGKERYVRAKVYSTYPLNTKHLLAINAGSADGLAAGMPVTVDTHLFLGTITEVFSDQSVVRTVFDEGVRLAVKIGDQGIEALLLGGKTPRLTLISNHANIQDGERVYTASRDLPFGIVLGTVAKIRARVEGAFQEADLEMPYDMRGLQEVFIRTLRMLP